jgi:hypothetical protein
MEATGEGKLVSSPSGFRFLNLIRLLVITLAVSYIFSRFIPASAVGDYIVYGMPASAMGDYIASERIDNCWAMALHEAHMERLQFGTDFVFTYGPWGFLARGYLAQTHAVSLVMWSILALIYMYAGWQLARGAGGGRVGTWAWLVLLAALATTPVGNDFDVRLVLFVTLFLLLHFFSEVGAMAKVFLVVALGCLSLVKFTGLVETAFVMCLVSGDDVFRRRRFPWAAPLWLASLIWFWVMGGQSLDNFWLFLVHSWQVAAGYTDAMMLPGNAPVMSLLGFAVIGGALWFLAARMAWVKLRSWAIVPLAGLAAILFIAFKLGYVRHDFHQVNSAMALLVIAALLLPLTWRGSKMLQLTAVGVLFVAGIFGVEIFHNWPIAKGLATQLAGTFRLSNLLAPAATTCTGCLQASYENEMARLAGKYPLPRLNGGCDLYSDNQAVLFAHGFHYQPRPVIQSYSAYTPELAQMNAAWLRSEHAASNLLFAVQPLDCRFPSLDDGLSWPEILTRYEVNQQVGPEAPFLLLQRRAVPRGYRLVSITNTEARLGENLEVPVLSTAPIWVEMTFKKTAGGKIISAAYKPPVLIMEATFRAGPPRRFRIIPGMSQAGFLLSPMVADNKSFAALFAPDWRAELAGREVRSLVIESEMPAHPSLGYQPSYLVHFYRLELSP